MLIRELNASGHGKGREGRLYDMMTLPADWDMSARSQPAARLGKALNPITFRVIIIVVIKLVGV